VKVASGLDWTTLNFEAYLIGKSIFVFTMIYCGMNWAMYRKARLDQEEINKENDNKKN
jgi:hypothetical protein